MNIQEKIWNDFLIRLTYWFILGLPVLAVGVIPGMIGLACGWVVGKGWNTNFTFFMSSPFWIPGILTAQIFMACFWVSLKIWDPKCNATDIVYRN